MLLWWWCGIVASGKTLIVFNPAAAIGTNSLVGLPRSQS